MIWIKSPNRLSHTEKLNFFSTGFHYLKINSCFLIILKASDPNILVSNNVVFSFFLFDLKCLKTFQRRFIILVFVPENENS